MSSAQISREGLLQMVQGGDGKTESYIEDIAPSEGGGAILHIFCNGKESAPIRTNSRHTAEIMLDLVKSDI